MKKKRDSAQARESLIEEKLRDSAMKVAERRIDESATSDIECCINHINPCFYFIARYYDTIEEVVYSIDKI